MMICLQYSTNRTDSFLGLLKHYWMSLVLLAVVLGTAFMVDFSKIISPKDHSVSDITPEYCVPYEQTVCENGGLLKKTNDGYACECKDGYYGVQCDQERYWKPIAWLKRVIDTDGNPSAGKPRMWWSFLPFTLDRQLKNVYRFHQNNLKRLKMFTDDGHGASERNMTSTRILPSAHPSECTVSRAYKTPLADVQRIFVRRDPDGAFKPDSKHRNILADTFYRYFVLQFFDADFNLTVTASQVYGNDETTKRELRLFSHGKLKTEILNGEHYPPSLSFAKRVAIRFSSMLSDRKSSWFNKLVHSSAQYFPPNWAMGNPMLGANPMFFAMSTLWVREHNRMCDVLRHQWPVWTDDRLYKTARNVVVGEMMAIMMDDVINVHSGHSLSLKHKPDIYHDWTRNVNGLTTPFELLLTAMWPSGLPDDFDYASLTNFVFFSDVRQVRSRGMSSTVGFMVNQVTGAVVSGNYGETAELLTGLLMKLSRENALQSFNNYRRKLGLIPYSSFHDLTGNRETAKRLAETYHNVEDVELLIGMLTEKTKRGVLSTVNVMTNSFVVNSIFRSPLYGKNVWKPETFGGKVGFDIVRSANIETFVCHNLVDKCSDGFKVKLRAN